MENKVYKYLEYIKENIYDTPESYIESVLRELKTKLEKMFSYYKVEPDGQIKKYGDIKKEEDKEKEKMSFSDLGLELQSLELSKYSKLYDNVKMTFSDELYRYDIVFTIGLKEASGKEGDFKREDIKECEIKFKKYSVDNFDLVASPLTKKVKIEDISEEFLIELKIELDNMSTDTEEFEIVT